MKKLIAVFGILLISIPVCYAVFSDVSETHPYFDAVSYIQSQGIVSGYPDGTYKPDNKINRAEFTKIIINTKFTEDEINNCTFVQNFADVPDDEWYTNYVCIAKNEGIISGYPDGTFMPNNDINFAEASKIVVNTYGLAPLGEADSSEHWYMPFVDALYLQAAVPATIMDYGTPITRGEMAYIIFGTETEQGYEFDETDDDTSDDTANDTSDDVSDDTTDDTANDTSDDTAGDDDSGDIYTAEYMKELITDCTKVMIPQSELPARYAITGIEVTRGGGSTDNYADCYQYIDFEGRNSDEYPITVRYLVAESEEVTHEQMEIIRNDMPNWGWEDQCESYIGGKLSFYVESTHYFYGGPSSEEANIADWLYDEAWDMTSYYEHADNGSNCGSAVNDNASFFYEPDEVECTYIQEDLNSGEFEGWIFFDYNGTLREDSCYLEVSDDFVKSKLETYYGADYMKAWDFFYDDYRTKKLTFVTYMEDGWFHRNDFSSAQIESSVYLGN